MKEILLPPIYEEPSDYDAIEDEIREAFKEYIYLPLVEELASKDVLKNSREDLTDAITQGRINYYRGRFTGQFNSKISREIKLLGGKWIKGAWVLDRSKIPMDVRNAISISQTRFQGILARLDKKISQILPEEIADKIKLQKHFDSALWKVDKSFQKSISKITIAPTLTPEARAKIAEEYTNDLKKYIKDWTEEEIGQLRKTVQKHSLSGFRYEDLIKGIQRRYDVSKGKAKFLARQETSLLMTKFKETRYTDAGVVQYRWGCVAGSKNHPVRPWHKKLEGKIFRWDDPPITTAPGEPPRRNNPGEDFNCRCFARPVVQF